MPPKQRITREMILERSFAMFCQEGMAAVNARSVAKALNCSTQPIFSYFSGMDDLKNALDQKAHDVFEQTVSEEAKDCPALEGSSNAYVRFATEQPRLFAHMFLREDGGMQSFGSDDYRRSERKGAGQRKGQARLRRRDALCARFGCDAGNGPHQFHSAADRAARS